MFVLIFESQFSYTLILATKKVKIKIISITIVTKKGCFILRSHSRH